MLLTHRSLHWNLKLWFILFRIPVPSVGENLVRMIKIDRNTRRFIFLEFIGCTDNGSSLVSETQYNFQRVFIFRDDETMTGELLLCSISTAMARKGIVHYKPLS